MNSGQGVCLSFSYFFKWWLLRRAVGQQTEGLTVLNSTTGRQSGWGLSRWTQSAGPGYLTVADRPVYSLLTLGSHLVNEKDDSTCLLEE